MLKINLHEITWDPKKVRKILDIQETPQYHNLLRKYANSILNKAKPKIPVDTSGHKGNATPLKDSFKISEVKYSKSKVKEWGDIKLARIKIAPAKRQKYYYVVMSGKNTYHGKKREIKYSSAMAESFPLEKETKKQIEPFYKEAMELINKVINND